MKKPETVFVKNNGKDVHRDRFDGEEIVIEPGQLVEIYADAARLCFGFGEKDKHRVIARLGWVDAENNMETALERLNKFSFHMEGAGHLSAPVVNDDTPAEQSSPAGASNTEVAVRVPGKPMVNGLTKLAAAQSSAG